MSFLSEELRGVDFQPLFESWGFRLPDGPADNKLGHCAVHHDDKTSCSIDRRRGLFHCFACGAEGDAVSYLTKHRGMSDKEAILELKRFFGVEDGPRPSAPYALSQSSPRPAPSSSDPRVDRWHQALLNDPDRIRWLMAKRGIEVETIRQHRLGWVGDDSTELAHRGRYSFPIRGIDGSLDGIRLYKPDHGGDPMKFLWADKGSKVGLYPIDVLDSSNIIVLCEGELDALLANQHGITAVTSTGGATSWKKTWTPLFSDKSVIVVYDNDAAGEKGADKVGAALLGTAREIRIVKLPVEKKGGDMTDWFMEGGGSAPAFWDLVQSTTAVGHMTTESGQAEATFRDLPVAAPADVNPGPTVAASAIPDTNTLRALVNHLLEKGGKGATKTISDAVFRHLTEQGEFYIDARQSAAIGAQKELTYYFNERTKDLWTITSPEFDALLYGDTWLNPKDATFDKVKADLHARAVLGAKRATIYTTCHYDEDLKAAYISRGGNSMYVLNGDEQIRTVDNGEDGILFKRGPRDDVWKADFDYIGEPILEMFDELKLEDHGELTADQQRLLLAVYTVAMCFPELQPTRLIPVFIGEHGSGKSFTARRIGQLWCGPEWQVATVEGEKEDDFARIITQDFAVCADNLDSRITWIHDMLARAATGAEVQRRQLYTNGAIWRAKIVSFLLITTREPRWLKREDVTSRCLPIRIARRADKFLAEHVLLKLEKGKREARMGHLLDLANNVVKQLRDGAQAKETSLRIADFAFLGELIATAMDRRELFLQAIQRLPVEQRKFQAEDHPVLEAIEEWLTRGNRGKSVELGQLYRELAEIGGWSERQGIRSARHLSRHMDDMSAEITRACGPFKVERDQQTRRQHYRWLMESDDDYTPAVEAEVYNALPF